MNNNKVLTLYSMFFLIFFKFSDVRRKPTEVPKGGMSESKLISQIALLGLDNYITIPANLNSLIKKKLTIVNKFSFNKNTFLY